MSRHKNINTTLLDVDVDMQGMESKGAEDFLATELLKYVACRQKTLVL